MDALFRTENKEGIPIDLKNTLFKNSKNIRHKSFNIDSAVCREYRYFGLLIEWLMDNYPKFTINSFRGDPSV
jgi:hypothetical protein